MLEDLQDGDVKMGGSFRGAFGNSDKGMNVANLVRRNFRHHMSAVVNELLAFFIKRGQHQEVNKK